MNDEEIKKEVLDSMKHIDYIIDKKINPRMFIAVDRTIDLTIKKIRKKEIKSEKELLEESIQKGSAMGRTIPFPCLPLSFNNGYGKSAFRCSTHEKAWEVCYKYTYMKEGRKESNLQIGEVLKKTDLSIPSFVETNSDLIAWLITQLPLDKAKEIFKNIFEKCRFVNEGSELIIGTNDFNLLKLKHGVENE